MKGSELPYLIHLKLQPVGESEYGGVGPLALIELRCNGFENSPKNDRVRTGMVCEQAKKLVVVPDAVAGRTQFLERFGWRVGIGGQGLPDERVRTFRETLQDQTVSLGTCQSEVVGRRGHEDGLSRWSKPPSCHWTFVAADSGRR